jgi:hypothetical protein
MQLCENIKLCILCFLDWEDFHQSVVFLKYNIQKCLYIYSKSSPVLSKLTMYTVCYKSIEYVEIFKYLCDRSRLPHLISINGMSTYGLLIYMNMASRNGHLNIIKYLHQLCISHNIDILDLCDDEDATMYDDEITMTDVIDSASEQGHLEIVKYLYKYGIKCTTDRGIDNPCFGGHLDVVKFLYKMGVKFTESSMQSAYSQKQYDVIEFLYKIDIIFNNDSDTEG